MLFPSVGGCEGSHAEVCDGSAVALDVIDQIVRYGLRWRMGIRLKEWNILIHCVGLTRSDIVSTSTRKGHFRGWRSIRKVCRCDSERSEMLKPETENGN
jgi:hypothetical protein